MLLAVLFAMMAAPGVARDSAVEVVATDFAFNMPDSLPAGATTFRLVNHGRELHHLFLARLSSGKTAKDLVAALRKGGPPPAWAVDVGGPNAADPGTTSIAATVALAQGHYAALCVIPGPDGVPHIMKGMYKDVTVTALPTIDLTDYAFSAKVPLRRGVQHVRVLNSGKQSHELVLVRLEPGKTPADLAAWAEKMAGPPPAHFLGGVSPIAPGHSNEMTLDLSPGHYVMLCFVPDAKDGKPHIAHGMVHDFVIQ